MDNSTCIAPHLSILSESDKHCLDTFGFLIIPEAIDHDTIQDLRHRCAELLAAEGERGGIEVHTEEGTNRLSNLINKGDVFKIALNHPRVLAGIHHVLGDDVKISSLNARFAKPGSGTQALHTDGGFPDDYTAETYFVCNSLWALDDISPVNGATRIVPGSHRSRLGPAQVMDNPMDDHPAQKIITATAGDVIVFNSHLWHSGTLNTTSSDRRCMHGYFTRRGCPQQTNQRKWLSAETISELTAWERYLCDV